MRDRFRLVLIIAAASGFGPVVPGHAQSGPSFQTRTQILRSLVYVRADGCRDGAQRAGTGFPVNDAGSIVTAHHVVGGCTNIQVIYETPGPTGNRLAAARIVRVLPTRDLALLRVDAPPPVTPLPLAPPPPDMGATYAGSGYQNGQRTAGDIAVTFTPGAHRLKDILPGDAQQELANLNSRIDLDQRVLRFNTALQPGTSGGPIVDAAGRVIGVVAGGLKAGAAPASWGWPSEWITDLFASNERDPGVRAAGVYYSLSDMNAEQAAIMTGRTLQCGSLTLEFRGTRTFREVATGADDQARLNYVVASSTRPMSEIEAFRFDVWTHRESGATALVPAGYPVQSTGQGCVTRSSNGPFTQVVWGASATDPAQIQQESTAFETTIISRFSPYPFGCLVDQVLTTTGPQFRPNGMVFNRKGCMRPKAFWMPGHPVVPIAHAFETLIAKSGTFLGVGTLNDDLPMALQACVATSFQGPGCASLVAHVKEWTHFVLATQLSTYPAT